MIITNDNLNIALEQAAISFGKSNYNDECFSTGDIKRYLRADWEIDEIHCKLKEAGVNTFKHVKPIWDKYKLGWYDNIKEDTFDKEELPNNLNVYIDAKALQINFNEDTKNILNA